MQRRPGLQEFGQRRLLRRRQHDMCSCTNWWPWWMPRPRSRSRVPVPELGGMVSRTLPLMVGTSSVAPTTASWMVTGSSMMMSSPSRRNSGCGATTISTSASPAAPPPNARHALALQPQHMAVARAGGDAHVQRLAFRQGDASAGAVGGVEEADGQRVVRVTAAGGEMLAAGQRHARPRRGRRMPEPGCPPGSPGRTRSGHDSADWPAASA
jgi:hypothetical protein